MIAPSLGVMPVYSKHRNFILDLDHENCVNLRVHLLDVLQESAEGSDFTLNDRFVVVRGGVVVDDVVRVHSPRGGLLVVDDVHWRKQLTSALERDRPVTAGV